MTIVQVTINMTSQNSGMQKVNLEVTNEACISQVSTHYCSSVWACLTRIFFGTPLFYALQHLNRNLKSGVWPGRSVTLMTLGVFYSDSTITKMKGEGRK